MKIQVTSIPRNPGGEVVPRLLGVVGASIRTTAILEKGEPFRESSPQHSVSTKGFVPCASQPVGPSSLRTALVEGGYEIYDVEMIGWFLLAVLVIIGALLIDHLGLVGREPRPITLGRIIGAGLMLLGVALVL
jgi:hypothetical protein